MIWQIQITRHRASSQQDRHASNLLRFVVMLKAMRERVQWTVIFPLAFGGWCLFFV